MTKNYKKSDHFDRECCREIYNNNCDSFFVDIPNKQFRNRFYAGQFFKLEFFVDELLTNAEIPFVPRISRAGDLEYAYTHLAVAYFSLLPDFVGIVKMLSPDFEYSERINAFIASCTKLGLLSQKLDWGNKIWSDPQKKLPNFNGMFNAEVFNALIDEIRINWKSTYKAQAKARWNEAEERLAEYSNYADVLFDVCSRLVIVRVDLYYKKELSNSITMQQLKKDLNHLYGNERKKPEIFGHKKGYIQKIEYGGNGKGIHIHMLYFFDGSKRNNSSHIHLAQQIGEYWVKVITKGRGDYWNVNAKVDEYEKKGIRGIGVINADDTKRRSNLKNIVIRYLCKIDQYIKPKFGADVKLIRRGIFPKKPPKKRGAPRKNAADVQFIESMSAIESVS